MFFKTQGRRLGSCTQHKPRIGPSWLQIQQLYASLNITCWSDLGKVLGLLQITSRRYSKLWQIYHNLRQVVITNYSRFVTNHDKMFCILGKLKYFITNYGSFGNFYKLLHKVLKTYDRYDKFQHYYKLHHNSSYI